MSGSGEDVAAAIRTPAVTMAADELSRQKAAAHNAGSFLPQLPGEVRNLIYGFCLKLATQENDSNSARLIPAHRQYAVNKDASPLTLTQVCQHIRAEFQPLYWGRRELWIDISILRIYLETFDGMSELPHKGLMIALHGTGWLTRIDEDVLDYGMPFGKLRIRTMRSSEFQDENGVSTAIVQADRCKWDHYLDEATRRVALAINMRCNTQIDIYLTPGDRAEWIAEQVSSRNAYRKRAIRTRAKVSLGSTFLDDEDDEDDEDGEHQEDQVVGEDGDIPKWMKDFGIPELEEDLASIRTLEFWKRQQETGDIKQDPEWVARARSRVSA